MQAIAIIGLCIAAAVAYGIIHDQITVRICLEYFSIGHPPIPPFPPDSPTLLALGWGIIATWWVGAILGIGLAIAARGGSWPKRGVKSLVRPVGLLMLATGACAGVMGVVGYVLGRTGAVFLVGWLAQAIPADKHDRFLADLWTHLASYAVSFVGGLIVIATTWRSRKRMKPAAPASSD